MDFWYLIAVYSGKIDHNEFRKLCYSMGHFLDDKSLDIALHTIGGSEITYPQFMAWYFFILISLF